MDSQYELDSLTAASHMDRKMLGSTSELEAGAEDEDEDEDEDE